VRDGLEGAAPPVWFPAGASICDITSRELLLGGERHSRIPRRDLRSLPAERSWPVSGERPVMQLIDGGEKAGRIPNHYAPMVREARRAADHQSKR